MKKQVCAMVLAVSLLLSGCSFLDGSYLSVTPHRAQRTELQTTAMSAADYKELVAALERLVSQGRETAAIHVPRFPEDTLEDSMILAVRYIKNSYPIGAYAVEDVRYELGTSGGVPAVAVTIAYRRSLTEIQQIRQMENMDAVETLVKEALQNCEASAVFLVEDYTARDMGQYVQDYASSHPQTVMETPQVTETTYGSGKSRVLELIFTYQNSRETLRNMQSQVQPVFNSAVLYVSGDGAQRQKFSQLYAFLMERFDYKLETSLTPAYSLLRHGVGDSRAFATVYAAMCRSAGLECMTVTGTCSGEPRTWNIVREGETQYYHVDLLRCSELGSYQTFTDSQMEGYVWDYSAYPACNWAPPARETEAEEEAPPQEETPESTEAPVTEETLPAAEQEETEPEEPSTGDTVPGETAPQETEE